MEQNFHRQKQFALVIAAIAFISLVIPWMKVDFLGISKTWNGFRGWGILSLFGIIGVAAFSLLGNKNENYTPEFKKYVMFSFAAISLGALLFFIRKNSFAGGIYDDIVKTGFGLYTCFLAGLAGIGILYGIIKFETKKTG